MGGQCLSFTLSLSLSLSFVKSHLVLSTAPNFFSCWFDIGCVFVRACSLACLLHCVDIDPFHERLSKLMLPSSSLSLSLTHSLSHSPSLLSSWLVDRVLRKQIVRDMLRRSCGFMKTMWYVVQDNHA